MYKIQTVYLPVKVENASGNHIPDNSVLLVKEPGEMDKNWKDLVKPQEGYFFTPEQFNEYTANVIKQALENAADKTDITYTREKTFDFTEVDKQSITNTFEKTYNKLKL